MAAWGRNRRLVAALLLLMMNNEDSYGTSSSEDTDQSEVLLSGDSQDEEFGMTDDEDLSGSSTSDNPDSLTNGGNQNTEPADEELTMDDENSSSSTVSDAGEVSNDELDNEEPNDVEDNVDQSTMDVDDNTSSIAIAENVDCVKKDVAKNPNNEKLYCSFREDEEQTCTICFESLTNAGDHRLASLKCGHLFGHKCIAKWLTGRGTKCPECNVKAKKSEIRIIFAKNLKVLDTTELTRALTDLEKEKAVRRKAELECAQYKVRYEFSKSECLTLKTELNMLRNNNGSITKNIASQESTASCSTSASSFVHEKTVNICREGECRVLAICDSFNLVAVSHPSNNVLFPGFGVKKLSILDFKTSEFVRLHSHPIRDMAFKKHLLLSASMDKTIKITNIASNSIVQTYTCNVPLWSCAWSSTNSSHFFAGTSNGKIFLFDMRNTSEHLDVIEGSGSYSPVVSMRYVGQKSNASFKYGGLLACQLNQCVFHQSVKDNEYQPHILPIQGNFTSIDFDDDSRHFLITSRPSREVQKTRHILAEIKSVDDAGIGCNVVQTMNGGSSQVLLSRSKLISCRTDGKILACAGDESSSSLMAWDVSTGNVYSRHRLSSPILDIGSIDTATNQLVLSLNDKTLSVYNLK